MAYYYQRCCMPPLFSFCLCWSLFSAGGVAHGQLLQRPVAIQHARLLTEDGRVIEDGTLLIKGERIAAVGDNVKIPLLARRVDCGGATITPGLIDAHSSLGRAEAAVGSGTATRRAEDAFDAYATRQLMEGLRNGVTAIYLSPGNLAGICGTGAVVRLSPQHGQTAFGHVAKSEAALCIDLASADKPIERLKTLHGVEKQFREALEYRQRLEDYEDDLAEYAKQLKEYTAKKKPEKESPEAEKAEKGTPKPSASAGEDEDDESQEDDAQNEGKAEKKDDDSKGDDPPKKPARPPRNPTAEVLLRAIDGQLPIRVAVDRSADIFGVLDLAEQYSLNVILEGAAEAHLIADTLSEAEVQVIFGRMDYSPGTRDDRYRRASSKPGDVLDQAGVSWIAASGGENRAAVGPRSRFLLFNAQLASRNASAVDPLRMLTARAADVLQVGDQIGRLRPGLFADFVVWSGDPCEPTGRVRQVYVGGELVCDLTDERPEGDEE